MVLVGMLREIDRPGRIESGRRTVSRPSGSPSQSFLLLTHLAALARLAAHLFDDLITAGQRRLSFEDLGDVQPDAPACNPMPGASRICTIREASGAA